MSLSFNNKTVVLKKTALISTLFASTLFVNIAHADVTLNFPDTVSLLAVNNEKADISGGLFSSEKSVTLPDGVNQIVFRYEPTFERGNNVYRFTSETIIARFESSNTKLDMKMPKYRNESDAKVFDQDANWTLTDTNGNALDVQQDKLVYSGLQIGRNYVAESTTYNQKGGIAAIAVATAAYVAPTTATPVQSAPAHPIANADGTSYQTTSEQMLHYWYNQADEASRARFLQAIQAK